MKFTSKWTKLRVPIERPLDGGGKFSQEIRFKLGVYETNDPFVIEYLDKNVYQCEAAGKVEYKEVEKKEVETDSFDVNNLPEDTKILKQIGKSFGLNLDARKKPEELQEAIREKINNG